MASPTRSISMADPTFTVIVATHQRAALLERALQSLRAQRYTDFEIIVVADAFDEGTALVCAQLLNERDVFVKRNGVPGPAASRNLALQFARGEWVTYLDDDDTYDPEHLQVAFEQIRLSCAGSSHSTKVLYSDFYLQTEERQQDSVTVINRARAVIQPQPVESLYVKNFIPNNALVFHRLALEGCEVDTHLQSQEDWDFILSVCQRHTPTYYEGGAAVVHKDYINKGTRRGTTQAANDSTVVLDFLHVYRRWPAPTPELKAQRQALLAQAGMPLPTEWF